MIFVSHNLAIIQALCHRGILLQSGTAIADGPVNDTIDRYLRTLETAATEDLLARTDRDGRGWDEDAGAGDQDQKRRRRAVRGRGGGTPGADHRARD